MIQDKVLVKYFTSVIIFLGPVMDLSVFLLCHSPSGISGELKEMWPIGYWFNDTVLANAIIVGFWEQSQSSVCVVWQSKYRPEWKGESTGQY